MKTNLNALSEPIKILRRIQDYGFKSAILAGGAIRDDYMDEVINDYDIFVWDPVISNEFNKTHILTQDEAFITFAKLIHAGFGEVKLSKGDKKYGPVSNGVGAKINAIWEFETMYDIIQIIFTQINPVEHVNKYFDIGLCKAYCDGRKIRYTEDFMRDVRNKTFTILGQDMTPEQFNYAIEYHIDKLQYKYPFFKTEVAPHNQHLKEAYDDINF